LTDDCIHLKDAIEFLKQRGRLKQLTKNFEPERQTVADGKNKDAVVAMFVEQLDKFLEHMEIIPYECTWECFPTAHVITGGISSLSKGSIKRKFEDLLSVNHLVLLEQKLGGQTPLALYDHELPGWAPNSAIPLLVQAYIANFDVIRVLIDTGAFCDIMYTGLFKTLQLTKKNLSPYVGSKLYGFNGSSTKP
jgi:hypothetical protein